MCVAGRELTEPRSSPDASTVAVVTRWGGSAAIVVVPVDGGPERISTTGPPPAPGRGFGGGCFSWLPCGSGLVYAAAAGDLWLQPVGPGPALRLTDHPDALVQAPSVSPDGSGVAYVVDQAEVWWIGLAGAGDVADDGVNDGDGRAVGTPVRLDDGSADFCFDPHVSEHRGDAAEGVSELTVRWQAWNVPSMPWDDSRVEIVSVTSTEGRQGAAATAIGVDARRPTVGTGAIQQPRTMPDGRSIEVRDDHGWLNVWIDGAPLVDERFEHAGPSWGMGQRSYAVSPDARFVAVARNEAGFGRLSVIERATGAAVDVGRGVHGQLDWRGDRLVALRSGARTPTQVVAYDTVTLTGSATPSRSSAPRRTLMVGPVAGWDAVDLPEPDTVQIPTGEGPGDTLHARRYVAGQGRTICWVHGGPTGQWQVEFMPRVAYWWAQGWDILVPDPRGSTGHGRAYQQALRGEWGRLDVDDTAAIIGHSHDRGWSTPATTVVMGASSGGLTALGVLGLHPGVAAGGVVMYPVGDLADLTERSHRFEAHYTLSLVGPLDGPPENLARYHQRSPLSYAHRIDVPLLVMHGDADPVVPVDQSIALADRIAAAGGQVELRVFEGEGHGLRDPANRLAEYGLIADFLERLRRTSQ